MYFVYGVDVNDVLKLKKINPTFRKVKSPIIL